LECIRVISQLIETEVKVTFADDRYGDLRYFVCDITRAREQLGWNPKVFPSKGIENLIEWIRENRNLFSAE